MMSALECYKEYLALKNHFNQSSYDYFKYNGKIKINQSSFDSRKDKLFFQKLAKHPDVHNFLVANLAADSKVWIRDIAYSESAEKIYKDWSKRQQSLSYTFRQELSKLDSNFDDNLIIKNNEHPILLKKYLGKEISLETICILLEMTGAKKHWDSKMQYDLIWDNTRIKIEKYTPFIKYDKEKIKTILFDYFK